MQGAEPGLFLAHNHRPAWVLALAGSVISHKALPPPRRSPPPLPLSPLLRKPNTHPSPSQSLYCFTNLLRSFDTDQTHTHTLTWRTPSQVVLYQCWLHGHFFYLYLIFIRFLFCFQSPPFYFLMSCYSFKICFFFSTELNCMKSMIPLWWSSQQTNYFPTQRPENISKLKKPKHRGTFKTSLSALLINMDISLTSLTLLAF